jgi:hypothetical protein
LQRGNGDDPTLLANFLSNKVRQRRTPESINDVKANRTRAAHEPVLTAFAGGHIGRDQRCGRPTQQLPRKTGAARNPARGL